MHLLFTSSKVLNLLKCMYKNISCRVKLQNFDSDCFIFSIGMKQGCVLSSLLFNIFNNDFVDFLRKEIWNLSWGSFDLYPIICRWHCFDCRQWKRPSGDGFKDEIFLWKISNEHKNTKKNGWYLRNAAVLTPNFSIWNSAKRNLRGWLHLNI